MEFLINGRNVTVSDRFREYASEKISKLEHLADRAQRVEVKITQQAGAKVADTQLTAELTVLGRGPVIRAEARAANKFAAFDAAYAKLLERLRRAKDKRKIHHGRHTPKAFGEVTVGLDSGMSDGSGSFPGSVEASTGTEHSPYEIVNDSPVADSPVLIRRKVFPASVMSVDDAVDNMELVGHDFYLFIDSATNAPSVVYRRRGWSYGVMALDVDGANAAAVPADEIIAYRSGDRAASA